MNVSDVRVVLSFARKSLNLMKRRKKPMSNSLRGAMRIALRKLFRHARLNAFIGKRSKIIFTERRKYEAEEDEREYLPVGRHRLAKVDISTIVILAGQYYP
jgi:hypothetical protein